MRKIFIYFSRTGNGDEVSKYMITRGYEIYKVEPKHNLPKTLFWSMMVGGFVSLTGKKARLKEWKINPNDYDEIVVGSPVWNDRLSTPINTVIHKIKDYPGRVKVILYAGGKSAKKATIKISKTFKDARSIVIQEPKKHPESYHLLDEFLR